MAIIKKTPGIYSRGVYELEAPFSGLYTPTTTYTCIAIKSFTELLPEIDPFVAYYEANGLTSSDYNEAIEYGVSIITLSDDEGNEVYVPDSHILSFPNESGVPYRRVVLSLDLGIVPTSESLALIKAKLKEVTDSMVGSSSTVQEHGLPITGSVSWEQHLVNLNQRQAVRSSTITDYAKLVAAERRISALEDYIAQIDS